MKKHIPLILIFLLFGPVMAQARKDLIVTVMPVKGDNKAFQLLCTAEEHTAGRSASSVFTTRLPTMPMRLGKWEESIYILSGQKVPMNKIHLIDDVTFTYPLAGISRKALLKEDPEEAGSYILTLFWYEGKMNRFMEIRSFRIWTIISLKPGKPEKIGSMEVTK